MRKNNPAIPAICGIAALDRIGKGIAACHFKVSQNKRLLVVYKLHVLLINIVFSNPKKFVNAYLPKSIYGIPSQVYVGCLLDELVSGKTPVVPAIGGAIIGK